MFFLIHIRRSYETYKLQNIPPSHKKGQAHTDTGINLYIRQAAMTHGKLMSGLRAEN
jgi:hypothetical protein